MLYCYVFESLEWTRGFKGQFNDKRILMAGKQTHWHLVNVKGRHSSAGSAEDVLHLCTLVISQIECLIGEFVNRMTWFHTFQELKACQDTGICFILEWSVDDFYEARTVTEVWALKNHLKKRKNGHFCFKGSVSNQRTLTLMWQKTAFSHILSAWSAKTLNAASVYNGLESRAAGLQRTKGFPARDPLSTLGMLQSQQYVPVY